MKRWEVTLIVRGAKIKHVVKADDEDGAAARAARAHPDTFAVATVKQLGAAV